MKDCHRVADDKNLDQRE